jgi:hypothetical protein
MITSNFRRERGCHRSKRTEARALQAELSERSRLRKTATKPAKFSGLNRRTSTYCIIIIIIIISL